MAVKKSRTKKTKKVARKKVTADGRKSNTAIDEEAVTEQARENIQSQLDGVELPKDFTPMDSKLEDSQKRTFYVSVHGQRQYPKLKFTCCDESEAIRQYRAIISVKNPTKYNFKVEEYGKK